jgi:hypothetical protein
MTQPLQAARGMADETQSAQSLFNAINIASDCGGPIQRAIAAFQVGDCIQL